MRKQFDIATVFWLIIVLIACYLCIFEAYRYDSIISLFSGIILLISLATFYYAYFEIPFANERMNKMVNQLLSAGFALSASVGIFHLSDRYNENQIKKFSYIADGSVVNYKYENDKEYGVIKFSVDNEIYFTDIENQEYKIKIGTKVTVECSKRQPERVGVIKIKK